jgi:hypothetical protein
VQSRLVAQEVPDFLWWRGVRIRCPVSRRGLPIAGALVFSAAVAAVAARCRYAQRRGGNPWCGHSAVTRAEQQRVRPDASQRQVSWHNTSAVCGAQSVVGPRDRGSRSTVPKTEHVPGANAPDLS